MEQKNLELEISFQEMLEGVNELSKKNEYTRRDLEDFKLSIQWNLGSLKGYQIFNKGEYTYKFNGELPDPNLLITFTDIVIAK